MRYYFHSLFIFIACLGCLPAFAASSFVTGVPKFDCSTTKATLDGIAGVAKVMDGTTTYYAGTYQKTTINQNPIIAAYDNTGTQTWCKQLEYEDTAVDGRTIGLLLDSGFFYAAFTVDGGSTVSGSIQTHTTNGWLTNYGSGGGAKVTVILRLNSNNGTVFQASGNPVGTFIISKLTNGNSNTLVAKNMTYNTGTNQLTVQSDAYHKPLDITKNTINASGSSPFDYSITFSQDLTTAISASITGSSSTPISANTNTPLTLLLTALAFLALFAYRLQHIT